MRAMAEDTLSRNGPWPWGHSRNRPQPGNCLATSQGRKGSEKRRSVLLLGPRGAKHPVMYGFSSDQRWVGRSLGLKGRQ